MSDDSRFHSVLTWICSAQPYISTSAQWENENRLSQSELSSNFCRSFPRSPLEAGVVNAGVATHRLYATRTDNVNRINSKHEEKQTTAKHWRLIKEGGAEGREDRSRAVTGSSSAAVTVIYGCKLLSSSFNSALELLGMACPISSAVLISISVSSSPSALADPTGSRSSFPNCLEIQRRPSDDFRESGSAVFASCGPPTRSAPSTSNSPKLDLSPLEDLRAAGSVGHDGGWLQDARRDGLPQSLSLSHRDGFLVAELRRTPVSVELALAAQRSLAFALSKLSSSAQQSTKSHSTANDDEFLHHSRQRCRVLRTACLC